jgi:hypothetical protein
MFSAVQRHISPPAPLSSRDKLRGLVKFTEIQKTFAPPRSYAAVVFGAAAPVGQGLLIHEVSRSQRCTTVGRSPLDE